MTNKDSFIHSFIHSFIIRTLESVTHLYF